MDGPKGGLTYARLLEPTRKPLCQICGIATEPAAVSVNDLQTAAQTSRFVSLLKELYKAGQDVPYHTRAYRLTGSIMAVYGYVRVSTVRQTEEGESLDVQQRTIAGYAMMHGLELIQTFVEGGVSGSVPLAERPKGKALMAILKPGDVVITAKLDRMFRSALDALGVLASLKARGVSLHMIDLGGDVTTNGISKLVFTILSAVAEAERDRTRERIAEVKSDQRKRNRYLGGTPPFGWLVGESGDLIPNPEQQQAVAQIRELRGQGLSLRAIAEHLAATGVRISHVGVKSVSQ